MEVTEMSDLEIVHAFSIRALQSPPFIDLDAIYIMNEVSDLDDHMMRELKMLAPYVGEVTQVLITGHDPGDPALREDSRFNQTAVPIMGGSMLGRRLSLSGVKSRKVFGAFTGYADSGAVFNTYTELHSIALFAKESGVGTLGIFCPDVHATRIAITMISVLHEVGAQNMLFWIIQVPTGGWDKEMSHSGGGSHPSGYDVVAMELKKFFGGQRYNNLVSVADTFTYFDWRDRMILQTSVL